jgi:hypothetical protein
MINYENVIVKLNKKVKIGIIFLTWISLQVGVVIYITLYI